MSDEAPEPTPPRRSRRALVLGGIAAGLAVGAVAIVLATRPGASPVPSASAPADAAPFTGPAPGPPSLPTSGRPGTGSEKLAGTVIDARGAPVANVVVTATLEQPAGAAEVVAIADGNGAFTLEGLEPGRHRIRVEGAEIFTAELRFVQVPSDGVRIAVARKVDVTGSVVDEGRPVPGAVVEIDGDALAGRRSTTTDAQGAFSFDELPEGDYRVWAHETDLAARALKVPRLGAGPFAAVTLTLEAATIVIGHVVDRATHVGIAAAVSIAPADDDSAEAARLGRSGPDGLFRVEGVPHGRWQIDAWAPGWLSTGALEVDAGRGTPEIELAAGAVIEGRVIDGRGRPVAGATVRARGEGALGRDLEASADVDADRLRRFSGFAPARVAASAAGADYASDANFIPRGELGVMTGPIPFPPPPGATSLSQSTMVDTTAKVASGDEPAPLPPDPAYAASFVTDDQGRFRITGLEGATWHVVASAAGMADGASKPVPLEVGKVAADVEIVLSPGTFLVGTVSDAAGGPLVGATITAASRDDDRDRVVAISGADGTYRMGPLTGDLTVTAASFGHADSRLELSLAAPDGDLPGEQIQDFALPAADATLRGRVLDADHLPVRGASLSVTAGGAVGRHAVTDDTGGFAITAVPAGDATVRVEHPDFPAQSFPIDTSRDTDLTLAWGGAIAGFVLDHHTGESLAGLPVSVSGPGERVDLATGPRGELTAGPLLAGTYTIRVQVPGYLPVEQTVEVSAATRAGTVTAREVRIELERGAILAGMVRDRYGSRVPGATVTISRDDGLRAQGQTDSEGEFRIRDAPTGDVTVHADKAGMTGTATATLRPGDEILSFVLDVK